MNTTNQKSEQNKKPSFVNNIEQLTKENATPSNAINIPQISLPNGGGALKGIDEKFKVNSANGTSAFSIPLPITPGRAGFSPRLSLNYNSGSGNGPFGLGWSVDLISIKRKTDKNIPRYRSGIDEDTFMLSGAEDLVPYLVNDGEEWEEFQYSNLVEDVYTVKRYRPRIEGDFTKIEKISSERHGVYWRTISADNITTFYGRNPEGQISNPEDESQIFEWLPELSYDDKGNWIRYRYKKEDLINVPNVVFEKNRIEDIAKPTNTYLKKIEYGNKTAYFPHNIPGSNPFNPTTPENFDCFFELRFDYGDFDENNPENEGEWDYRPDAFSTFRSGFEIRTNRRCKRILMLHHFEGEKQIGLLGEEVDFGQNYLVRSYNLEYENVVHLGSQHSETSYPSSITQSGYIRKSNGTYSEKSLPPIEFSYQNLNWSQKVRKVARENIANAPVGLTNNYQWVDIYGEGISGILSESGEGWYYKSNLGDIKESGDVRFTNAAKVAPKPSLLGLNEGLLSLQNLKSNGEKQIVVNTRGVQGYFELSESDEWKPFKSFVNIANIDFQDPNIRMVDLTGDGQPDIIVSEENVFTWFASDGENGHLQSERTKKPFDEELGPAIVFSDGQESIFLADMNGDGLTDIARIRNGEVCYWANMGYGRFSAKVTMSNAPVFDHIDNFNPKYLHLADISGTGATDMLYLGKNEFQSYINLSGNSWSDPSIIQPALPINSNSKISVIDLLGTGTSCIVWSSDLSIHSNSPLRYIDLMNGKKPHVLTSYRNNMGKETHFHYRSSTYYYLKDKLAGKPWISKVPFPIQLVSKVELIDRITNVRFTTEYKYHHGYYDPFEREFRGFGMVEQLDSEEYEEWKINNDSTTLEKSVELYQAPMLTKTWFHTGVFLDRETVLNHFKKEYWFEEYNRKFPHDQLNIVEPELPGAILSEAINSLGGDEYREALRACKGMVLRQEVFALDAPKNPEESDLQTQMKPYTVQTHNCEIQLMQPRLKNEYGVFLVTQSEALTISYERDETDYRLSHKLNTKFDKYGNPLESATVVYGRSAEKARAEFLSLLSNTTDFSEDVVDNNNEQAKLRSAFEANVRVTERSQTKTNITFTKNSYAKHKVGDTIFDDIDKPNAYRLRLPCETKIYELIDFETENALFSLSDFDDVLNDDIVKPLSYEFNENADVDPFAGFGKKRLIEHIKSKYYNNDLEPLDFELYDSLGLEFESYQLAFSADLLQNIYSRSDGTELRGFNSDVSSLIENEGHYFKFEENDDLWIRSGIIHYKEGAEEPVTKAAKRFYSAIKYEDALQQVTKIKYDNERFENGVRLESGFFLYVKETENAVGHKLMVDKFNYRTMMPSRMFDINANPSTILIDELGLVKALIIEGNGNFANNGYELPLDQKADGIGNLTEFDNDEDDASMNEFFNASSHSGTDMDDLIRSADKLLSHATIRFVYDFDAYKRTHDSNKNHILNNEPERVEPLPPVVVSTIKREDHHNIDKNKPLDQRRFQIQFEYTDGFGKLAMSKIQAEPGIAFQSTIDDNGRISTRKVNTKNRDSDAVEIPPLDAAAKPQLRWIGQGRTVLNNKGNPVKQYEPYFSINFLYEDAPELVERGVSPTLIYDSLGRKIKTKYPDGTSSMVKFDSWKQQRFDQNDTVLESDWHHDRINNNIDDSLRSQGKDPEKERRAALKTALHSNTPDSIYLDSLARPVLSIAHNGRDNANNNRLFTTSVDLDIEGNTRTITDARGNIVMAYKYDMLGHRMHQNSMDAGESWNLNNSMSNPIYQWDSKGHVYFTTYDELQRPINQFLEDNAGNIHLIEKMEYGVGMNDSFSHNLNGQLINHYDSSGRLTNVLFDYKGNVLKAEKKLAAKYKAAIINWSNGAETNELEAETFTSITDLDALNRTIRHYKWHKTNNRVMVEEPIYNERGDIKSQSIVANAVRSENNLRSSYQGGSRQMVTSAIEYNEKGQRTKIVQGNGTTTRYHYDKETFRLIQLRTTRAASDASLPDTPSNLSDPNVLQNLYYTYDPVGNIVEIEDDAYEPVFFRNQQVEPKCNYSYDPIYRLIGAEGRENHTFDNVPVKDEAAAIGVSFPKADKSLRNYIQKYSYDPVGNILMMRHQVQNGVDRWTRTYSYADNNNRLLKTWKGGDVLNAVTYRYDVHGNILNYVNTASDIDWNHMDMMYRLDLGGGGSAYYQYNVDRERSRKRIEKGGIIEERVYLGDVEVYRRWNGGPVEANLQEEIETHHISDGVQRSLIIENVIRTDDVAMGTGILFRFQYSNHIGSVGLEMNLLGEIISYEEYHPYGTVAYRATNSTIRAKAKRFRYTGMERDEESGLNYHTARYYLPWLGRWLKLDPAGLKDGVNMYSYVSNNPILKLDKTGKEGKVLALGRRSMEFEVAGMKIKGTNLPETHAKRAAKLSGYSSYRDVTELPGSKRTFNTADPSSSARLVRQALSGQHNVRAVYINSQQVGLSNADVGRFHTSAELRTVLETVAKGGHKTDVYIEHGEGTTVFKKGSTTGQGAKLPEPLSKQMSKFARTGSPARPKGEGSAKPKAEGRLERAMRAARASKPKLTAARTVQRAMSLAIAGEAVKDLYEGKPGEAAKTVAVGGGSLYLMKKVPALVPLAVMASSIQAYDDEIQAKAESDGKAWEDLTGSRTVGAITSSASATGRSVFDGTFGVTGRAIGQGAAAVYLLLTE